MKATLLGMGMVALLWGLLVSPLRAEQTAIRLDNFWSDGPVSIFLYEQPSTTLEPTGYIARHDLRAGEVSEIAADGHRTLWADVRIMHEDGQQWLLSSSDCGYGNAIAVHPGESIEVSYDRDEGYATGGIGLRCRVRSETVTH